MTKSPPYSFVWPFSFWFSNLLLYTQSPIIRNGPIRLSVEFLGKFKKQALGRSNSRNAWKNLRNAKRSDFQSLETSNIFHLYLISFFKIFLFFGHSTLSVELNFVIIAMFLPKLANFKCSIMGFVVMAGYFWKNLRNG